LAEEPLYQTPDPNDFRQGDIYRDIVSLTLTSNDPGVLRTFEKGGYTRVNLHTLQRPPQDGFHWDRRPELVSAEGKKAHAIVLTHDCEIENEDEERYRQVALIRPLADISDEDARLTIISGGHIGRLYLPSEPSVGFPESYVDLRAVTTFRRGALPPELRVVSLTDYGRRWLQSALVAYFTELSPTAETFGRVR
jgi:hypothetical protein